MPAFQRSIILYDGVCGLCNGFNRFVLARDRRETFFFAPLQSALGKEILLSYGLRTDTLDTLCVVPGYPDNPGTPLARARAVLFVAKNLNFPWPLLAWVVSLLPYPILNLGYRVVARHRYRLFGKKDACPIPAPAERKRFLDL